MQDKWHCTLRKQTQAFRNFRKLPKKKKKIRTLGCQLPDARRWVLLRMTRIPDFPIKKVLWIQTQTLGIEQRSPLTEKNTSSSHSVQQAMLRKEPGGKKAPYSLSQESASAPGLPKKSTGVQHHVRVTSAHWDLEQPNHRSQPCLSSPLRWLLTHQEKRRGRSICI